MTTTQNIQTLSLTSRVHVHNALIAAGITGESHADAMHSRLSDLTDTLDSTVLARVVAVEQEQAAWAAISTITEDN